MMLKTVYGPPPADEERIEATDLEADSEFTKHTGLMEETTPRKEFGG